MLISLIQRFNSRSKILAVQLKGTVYSKIINELKDVEIYESFKQIDGRWFCNYNPDVYLTGANILIQKKYNISESESLKDFYSLIKDKYPEEFI